MNLLKIKAITKDIGKEEKKKIGMICQISGDHGMKENEHFEL